MPHYPYLHRGNTIAYCWDASINFPDNISFLSQVPTQYGSAKYNSLADILYDPNIGSEIATNLTTRTVRLNCSINFPFTPPYNFPGWTYDPIWDLYRKDSDPTNKFFRSIGANSGAFIYLYFHIDNQFFSTGQVERRPNRRNVDFYYLVTAAFSLSLDLIAVGPPTSMRQPSFNLVGSLGGEYQTPITSFFGRPPFLRYPETDLLRTCPLPTIRCCNSNAFREINASLNTSELTLYTDDLSYRDTLILPPTDPDFLPIEIYDYILQTYNSIKNDLAVFCSWRVGCFPGFIPLELPNSSILNFMWSTGAENMRN